jgi:hypothetical protein
MVEIIDKQVGTLPQSFATTHEHVCSRVACKIVAWPSPPRSSASLLLPTTLLLPMLLALAGGGAEKAMEKQAAASFPGPQPGHDRAVSSHDLEELDGHDAVGEPRRGGAQVSAAAAGRQHLVILQWTRVRDIGAHTTAALQWRR